MPPLGVVIGVLTESRCRNGLHLSDCQTPDIIEAFLCKHKSPFHRGATRNNDVASEGPSDFNPAVPRANAVTSRRMLAQMI